MPEPLSPQTASITRLESYQLLLHRRKRLIIPLVSLMLVAYYGFILAVAFAHDFLSQTVGEVSSLGIWLGLGLILLTLCVTGFYVSKANQQIEPLIDDIQRSAQSGAKAKTQG